MLSHSSSVFGLNRDLCTPRTRQDPTGARRILPLQINYLGGAVAFTNYAAFPFRLLQEERQPESKCDVEQTARTGGPAGAQRN